MLRPTEPSFKSVSYHLRLSRSHHVSELYPLGFCASSVLQVSVFYLKTRIMLFLIDDPSQPYSNPTSATPYSPALSLTIYQTPQR